MDKLYKDIYTHIFSFLSHKELIKLMLVSKSFYNFIDNLNLPNVDFYTSCEKGYYLNIRKLGLKNQNLNKALYFASKGGYMPIVKLLISNGANNWDLGFRGACEGGQQQIVDFMYQNIVNDYNKIIEKIGQSYLFEDIKSVEILIAENLISGIGDYFMHAKVVTKI